MLIDLAASQHSFGEILVAQSKSEEAVDAFRQVLSVRERLAQDEPKNPIRFTELANTGMALGNLHWQKGRFTEGAQNWQKAVKALETAGRQAPDRTALDGPLQTMLRTSAERLHSH